MYVYTYYTQTVFNIVWISWHNLCVEYFSLNKPWALPHDMTTTLCHGLNFISQMSLSPQQALLEGTPQKLAGEQPPRMTHCLQRGCACWVKGRKTYSAQWPPPPRAGPLSLLWDLLSFPPGFLFFLVLPLTFPHSY